MASAPSLSPESLRCDFTFPTAIADSSFCLREVSVAAAQLGLVPGTSLLLQLPEEERILHEKYCRRAPDMRFNPLGSPQSDALYTLRGIPGYPFLYAEYIYTLREVTLQLCLLPDRQQYRELMREERTACVEKLRVLAADSASAGALWSAFLASHKITPEETDAITAALHTLQKTTQILHSPVTGETQRRLVHLPSLLQSFCECVLPLLYCTDCSVLLTGEDSPALCASLDPDSFLLLMAALFSVLSALAADRAVGVFLAGYGEDREIRFRIRCPRAAHHLRSTPDLRILTPLIPHRETAITVAETVIAGSGFDARLISEESSDTLTLSLFLPHRRNAPEFKSPGAADTCIRDAIRVAGGLLCLLNAQQKQ